MSSLKNKRSFGEFVKFCLVGASNTVISYLLNVATLFLLRKKALSFDYMIANAVAFLLSVLWSFFWNNYFVFKVRNGEKRYLWKSLFKTYISYFFTCIILANLLSFLWIERFGISKYAAPLLNLLITIPVNFILNKLWAFRTTKNTD